MRHVPALSALIVFATAAPAVAAPPTFSGPTPFDAGAFPFSLRSRTSTETAGPTSSRAARTRSAPPRSTCSATPRQPARRHRASRRRRRWAPISTAWSLAAADVDGDGKLDLISANAGPPDADGNAVSVRINTTAAGAATPTFAAPVVFAAGEVPRSVAAVDVNADGRPDLVTANEEGTDGNSVLMNTTTTPGAPAFSSPTGFEAGDTPRSLVAVDLNRDGRPDLVDGQHRLLRHGERHGPAQHHGGRRLRAVVRRPTPFDAGSVPRGVAAPDLNGGRQARPRHRQRLRERRVSVLVQRRWRAGPPRASRPRRRTRPASPASVAAADVNRDGQPDLVTANTFGAVPVLVNATEPGEESPAFAAPSPASLPGPARSR